MITRKKFLALSSLGAVSLFFPNFLFSKSFKRTNIIDVDAALKEAASLRSTGKLVEAKKIYDDILIGYPGEVRAYDGLRKIILSGGQQEDVIKLLSEAVKINPESADIKQRLYREYFNAAMGNKKLASTLGIEGRVLVEVQEKYTSFLEGHSNHHNIAKQLEKINKFVEWNADTENPHTNVPLKKYRKDQYQYNKNRFNEYSTEKMSAKLEELLSKPNNDIRRPHIREMYQLTLKKYRKEKNTDVALEYAVKYYDTVNKQDPLFIKYIRDLAKYQKKYDTLIELEAQNHNIKKTFWSALALFDAHLRKVENDNSPIPAEANTLMAFLKVNTFSPVKKFEYITRQIKVDIITGNSDAARNSILEESRNMYGITNPHLIDRMNVLAAKFHAKKGDNDAKDMIINIAVNPGSYTDNPDEMVKSLALMNLNRDSSNISHLQNLQKLINKL
ncbi:tetratricopeptide repeat protein [Chryseobacterium tongliaoense]|uniref:tetratricopeptide repeat protein n=1 Tax=Chryseobacterium tongliaoense TaxID=3240933 RepID=UPI0035120F3F